MSSSKAQEAKEETGGKDGRRERGQRRGKEKEREYTRPTVQRDSEAELYWLHNMSVWCSVDSQLGAFVSGGSIVWGSEHLSGYEGKLARCRQTDTCRHPELSNPSPLSWRKQWKIRDREDEIFCQSRRDRRKTKFSLLLSLLALCRLFRLVQWTAKPASMSVIELPYGVLFCLGTLLHNKCHDWHH